MPHPVVPRGADRLAVRFDWACHLAYLAEVERYSIRYGVGIHAWGLLTNHVHLFLITPQAGRH